jgi:DnaJ-class molecular chaperone
VSGGERGDLLAEIRIVVPEALGDRQRELYRQLAELAQPAPAETADSAAEAP